MNKIIAKSFLILATIGLLASCTNEQEEPSVEAYGTVRFAIGSEESRALNTSYDKDAFQVSVKQGNTTVIKPQAYSALQNGVLIKVGSGYQAYAESCSESEAENANGGWGCIRYYGASEQFSVAKNEDVTANIPCEMVNAAVSIQVDEQVASNFPAYQLTLTASDDNDRNLTFTNASESNTAYFNVSESRTIKYVLTVGENKTISQSFTIQPKHSYTLDIHMQTATEITVSIGVTVDNNIDEDTTTGGDYNPYL